MNEFIERCEKVADELGLEIIDTYDDGEGNCVVEDDGILHVTEGDTRVAFDVSFNQSLSSRAQDRNSKAVLDMLGIDVHSSNWKA